MTLESAAADGYDDFKHIALGQQNLGMPAARHDFAIAFDGDALAGIAQRLDQRGDGHRRGELARLAIQRNFHARHSNMAEYPAIRARGKPARKKRSAVPKLAAKDSSTICAFGKISADGARKLYFRAVVTTEEDAIPMRLPHVDSGKNARHEQRAAVTDLAQADSGLAAFALGV